MVTTTLITDRVAKAIRKVLKAMTPAVVAFHLAVEPVPASRPRVGKFGTYYTKSYSSWKTNASKRLAAFEANKVDGDLILFLDIVATKPKTGKLTSPKGDVDNYTKGIMDAMTSAERFWEDDRQVVAAFATKRYALPGEEPGYTVEVFRAELIGDIADDPA